MSPAVHADQDDVAVVGTARGRRSDRAVGGAGGRRTSVDVVGDVADDRVDETDVVDVFPARPAAAPAVDAPGHADTVGIATTNFALSAISSQP